MPEKCVRCESEGEDRRTLFMSCLYAMEELKVPFEQHKTTEHPKVLYTLRVCKSCRADWLSMIQKWFVEKPNRSEPTDETLIPVRENETVVFISEEEWFKRRTS